MLSSPTHRSLRTSIARLHPCQRAPIFSRLKLFAAAAVELLTSDRLDRIKRCGECDWLFLDGSKNASRTWCKRQCSDRIRARRHYDRTRPRRADQKKKT